MKYKYFAAYKIRGLRHSHDTGDVEVYATEAGYPVRAVLTERVDDHCYELDRAQALGVLVLKGLVGQRESDDLTADVKAEIERIRERRKKQLCGAELLIFTAEGEVEADFSRPSRETHEFVVGCELVNKSDIATVHSTHLNAALTALCLSVQHESIQLERIQRGIYLLNEFGKPVYSIDISLSASATVSRGTTEEVIGEVRSRIEALAGRRSLPTVNRLFVQAVSSENEKLPRFLFGWAALEVFVGKVFRAYRETLLIPTPPETAPADCRQNEQPTLDVRVCSGLTGSENIADKFAVIARWLGGATAETDLQTFCSIKGEREKLYHEGSLDEDSLPIAATIALLQKYLRLHTSQKET